jgi:hypothetical protein
MKDYSRIFQDLKSEIIKSITELVIPNTKTFIPYYYDEDDIDEDIETLIEDNYNVIVGSVDDNLSVTIENVFSVNVFLIDVVAIINDNGCIKLVSKEQELYYLDNVLLFEDFIKIYEKIANK